MSQELGAAIANRLGVDSDEQRERFLENVLQGRSQTVDEIAAAAVFLASDEAAVITGQAINVDGGMAYY
jgi:3-oxoacyl-[acyl-carrier protein] reductase